MAEKSADNIIQGILKSKKAPFDKILFGLGIRFVGEAVAKKLTAHFKNIEKLRNASFEELCSIEEVGEKIAKSTAYFKLDHNNEIVNRLLSYGLNGIKSIRFKT